jgi:hypothetical protein
MCPRLHLTIDLSALTTLLLAIATVVQVALERLLDGDLAGALRALLQV